MSSEGAWIVLLLAVIAGTMLGGWLGALAAVAVVLVFAG